MFVIQLESIVRKSFSSFCYYYFISCFPGLVSKLLYCLSLHGLSLLVCSLNILETSKLTFENEMYGRTTVIHGIILKNNRYPYTSGCLVNYYEIAIIDNSLTQSSRGNDDYSFSHQSFHGFPMEHKKSLQSPFCQSVLTLNHIMIDCDGLKYLLRTFVLSK